MGAIVPQKPSRVLAAIDQFMAEEFATFGQVRPAAPPPTSAKLLAVPMICSHTGQPFHATFGRDREGERYHVKSNRQTYAKLLSATGYELLHPSSQTLTSGELDWTGFQCEHCAAGCVTGFPHDHIFCARHKGLICSYRVEQIHGGGTKHYCPQCRVWGMLRFAKPGEPDNQVTGLHYEAHAPNRAQAAPALAPAYPAVQHTPASAPRQALTYGGYGTSLMIRPGGR